MEKFYDDLIIINLYLHSTWPWAFVTSYFLTAITIYQDLIDDKDTTTFLGFPKSFWT